MHDSQPLQLPSMGTVSVTFAASVLHCVLSLSTASRVMVELLHPNQSLIFFLLSDRDHNAKRRGPIQKVLRASLEDEHDGEEWSIVSYPSGIVPYKAE